MSISPFSRPSFVLRAAALATPLFLGACFLPPAATVASTAIDGFSFLVSGKSVTSHALSFLAQRDCSLIRGVAAGDMDALCRPGDETLLALAADAPQGDRGAAGIPTPETARTEIAAAEAAEAGQPTMRVAEAEAPAPFILVTASATRRLPTPLGDTAALAPPPPPTSKPRPILLAALDGDLPIAPAAATPATAAPSPEKAAPDNRPAVYLVVGSFRLADRAQALIERLADLSPGMAIGIVKGKVWFRVVVGPLEGEALDAMRATMAEHGVPNAWAIRLCTADLTAPPCDSPGSPASLGPTITLAAVDVLPRGLAPSRF